MLRCLRAQEKKKDKHLKKEYKGCLLYLEWLRNRLMYLAIPGHLHHLTKVFYSHSHLYIKKYRALRTVVIDAIGEFAIFGLIYQIQFTKLSGRI